MRAISLTDNQPFITAVSNDIGFEHVFEEQLRNMLQLGDVVVAISASGNSPNVVKAIEFANSHGAVSIGLVGFDGGRLREISQIVLHVPTDHGEYGPVEDIHLILDHMITEYLIMKG